MYLADAFGYLGYVGVMMVRNFGGGGVLAVGQKGPGRIKMRSEVVPFG
jgi:hypothetical protein